MAESNIVQAELPGVESQAVIFRVHFMYRMIKEVLPLYADYIPTKKLAFTIARHVKRKYKDLTKADPAFETYRYDKFLYSPAWLRRRMKDIELVAAANGEALLIQPFKGVKRTDDEVEIFDGVSTKQAFANKRCLNLNRLIETYHNNAKYQLSFKEFPLLEG